MEKAEAKEPTPIPLAAESAAVLPAVSPTEAAVKADPAAEIRRFVRAATLHAEHQKKSRRFDAVSLLQYREPIAGVSIGEDAVRFVLYEIGKDGEPSILGSSEAEVPEGTIVQGELLYRSKLAEALKSAHQNLKGPLATSVVLTLPPERAWFTILELPKHLTKSSVEEAVNLSLQFAVPVPSEETYLDWEFGIAPESGIWEILVGTIRKEYVTPYLSALEEAGLTAVAVETHALSLFRAVEHSGEDAPLAVALYPGGAAFFAYRHELLRFHRFLPWKQLSRGASVTPESLKEWTLGEVKKIIRFLAADEKLALEVNRVLLVGPEEALAVFPAGPIPGTSAELVPVRGQEPFADSSWYPALGAGLRGIIPRGEDAIISFTPVGTEEIYEWKRAISFSAFFEKLAVGLGLFFVLLYLGSYFFLLNLASRAELRQTAQFGVSQDLIKIQEEARRFNSALGRMETLQAQAPRWENTLEALKNFSNPGITITEVSASDPAGITVVGIAESRDALLQFKAALGGSGVFKEPNIPFAALIERQSVPFRFSLAYIDPRFVFKIQ